MKKRTLEWTQREKCEAVCILWNGRFVWFSTPSQTNPERGFSFPFFAGVCLVSCELLGYWAWRSVAAGRQAAARERERESRGDGVKKGKLWWLSSFLHDTSKNNKDNNQERRRKVSHGRRERKKKGKPTN